MKIENVQIKHSISRGRDTYGYNIVTAVCNGKSYRTLGGGYDMIGTVLGDWFETEYQDDLTALVTTLQLEHYVGTTKRPANAFYGLFVRDDNSVYIDGACGISCVLDIIRACGYKTKTCSDKNGRTESFLVWKE